MTQDKINLKAIAQRTQKTYKQTLRRCVYFYLKSLWKEVAAGKIVPLPCNIGALQVIEKDTPYGTEFMHINWVATKKLWQEKPEHAKKTFIYFDNLHTGGRYCRLIFRRSYTRDLHMIWLYEFITPVIAKRLFSKAFKEGQRYHNPPNKRRKWRS